MSAYPSWPCSYSSIEPVSTPSLTKKPKKKKTKTADKASKKISIESISKSDLILSFDKFIESFNSLPVFSNFQGEVVSTEPPTVKQTTYEILADYNIFNNTDSNVDSKNLVASTCEIYGIDPSLVESILVQREPGSSIHKITIERLIF